MVRILLILRLLKRARFNASSLCESCVIAQCPRPIGLLGDAEVCSVVHCFVSVGQRCRALAVARIFMYFLK